jgi:uncharacterized low-complexity protein
MKKIILTSALVIGTAVAFTGCAHNEAKTGSCGAGKCGAKKVEKKASCGSGKCGGDVKKKVKGSCGSGKCGH